MASSLIRACDSECEQDVAFAGPTLGRIEPARGPPFAVLAPHGLEQRVVEGVAFPVLDGVFVEAEEDAFAAVLDDWHPRGRTLALDRRDTARVVWFAGADRVKPHSAVTTR